MSAGKPTTSYLAVKRALDVGVSACAIAVGIVPSIILCIFVAADTKANPIYTQVRVGRNAKPFTLYKFRTMDPRCGSIEDVLTPEQLTAWRTERKVEDDPRITRFGRALRSTSLDEFPQFLNVLLGQMSIVGPRPITFEELEEWYGDDAELLTSVRPGMTGPWQTGPRNRATFESGERQRIELGYVRELSARTDLTLFFKTFKTIFERTGK